MPAPPAAVILDPSAENRAEAHRVLALAGVNVVAEGGHGVEGHTLVGESRPDCVLLGLEAPFERGLQTLEAVAASYPATPVIAYSTTVDGPSVRQAMLAGAADYLSFPLSGKDAVESIGRALERAASQIAAPGQGKAAGAGLIVTVFGAKGGTGKTTIATNLAVALAKTHNAAVAVVDLDPRFGDVAIMMDTKVETSLADAARDAAQLDRTTIKRYLTKHESGVFLLPAPTEPNDWEAITPAQVAQIVRVLAQTHDYVVLDTPGAFNEIVAAALDLATIVLLVTSPELSSVKNSGLVLKMLRSWSFPEEKLRLTVNHQNRVNSVTAEDVGRTLDMRVFWAIPHDEAVLHSVQVGKPVVLSRPGSRAAGNFKSLAASIGGAAAKQKAEQKTGLIRRLVPLGG